MKIVNLDSYATNPGDLSWDFLNKYGECEIYERTAVSEIVQRSKEADVLILNKTPITRETLDMLPKLKYIGLQSTGYNVVDCEHAKQLGIIVSNIPEYSTMAVAQHTFALMLELTNRVGLHSESVHDGEWCRCKDFCYWKSHLFELTTKTLGIIGFGKIGRTVAEIGQAFGMNILAYSPSRKEKGNLNNIEFTDIKTILTDSDVVSLHCPLTPKTENLINADSLQTMKSTALLINTSRGPVINEIALAQALKACTIAGAALDVLTVEPCDSKNPLLGIENCIITPHIAWAGYETRARLLKILEENLKSFIDNKPQNIVNK